MISKRNRYISTRLNISVALLTSLYKMSANEKNNFYHYWTLDIYYIFWLSSIANLSFLTDSWSLLFTVSLPVPSRSITVNCFYILRIGFGWNGAQMEKITSGPSSDLT